VVEPDVAVDATEVSRAYPLPAVVERYTSYPVMALTVPATAPDQFSVTFVLGATLLLATVTEDGAVQLVGVGV